MGSSGGGAGCAAAGAAAGCAGTGCAGGGADSAGACAKAGPVAEFSTKAQADSRAHRAIRWPFEVITRLLIRLRFGARRHFP